MKRQILTLAAVAATALSSFATTQSIALVKGNVFHCISAWEAQMTTFNDGKTITVANHEYVLADYDSITVLEYDAGLCNVFVYYGDDETKVMVSDDTARAVDITIDGNHVKAVQTADVSDTYYGEIRYILEGRTSNGSFSQSGNYDCTVYLRGLTMTNPNGAAINVDNTRRTILGLEKDSENVIADGAGGKQKAAIYSKGNFDIYGAGTLKVTGLTGHAISAKDYITFKDATMTIDGAVKDGLNCNRYFTMESGTINISGTGDDGIQVSYKSDTDREADDTGSITITGGTINVADITAEASKCIKCDGDFTITDGAITARTSANGTWDSAKTKTKASACIGADGSVTIDGGTLDLTATGHGGKGINCDSSFVMNGGDVTIKTSGNMVVYYNNTLYQGNYTGNTDRIASDSKSSPKGVKSDGEVVINGGRIDVTTTGTGGEGIESKSTLTVNDGDIRVRAYDDGINSANDMMIKGGRLDVISSKNDGLDANGNIRISGGVVMAFGAGSPECGLDANDEEGYTVYFTGGYILAAGGSHSFPKNSSSTQPYVTVSSTLTANGSISIGSGSDTYYTFTIPADYKASTGSTGGGRPGPGGTSGGSTVLISVPELKSGQSYTVKNGTSTSTATARLTGSSSGRPF